MVAGSNNFIKNVCACNLKGGLLSLSERNENIVTKQPTNASRKQHYLLMNARFTQHVSASHCHHQVFIVISEATQAICIVDVCGLQSIQCGQLCMDVTKTLLVTSFDN
jgi:hypothetical protein